MNRLWIPALLATAAFSANAFAYHDRDDEEHCDDRYRHRVEHVVVHHVYEEPQVVYREAPPVIYQAPPQVVYRERVVYRDRPAYYDAGENDAPQPVYPRYDGNRAVGQVVGAVAGGLIGNGVGGGNGRIAATALGAVIGSMVGGSLAGDGY